MEGENISKAEEDTSREQIPVINTHAPHLHAHFESYAVGEKVYENGEEELDPIREEIAAHFGVPIDEEHMLIVDNEKVENQRHQRAFCVVVHSPEDGAREAWYIDGRTGHAVMLRRLYNHYKVPDDPAHNEIHLGFLSDEAFSDVPKMQQLIDAGKPIKWFVRDTVNGMSPSDFL